MVRVLVEARLLTMGRDERTAEQTVEVAHEALIRNWPRFAEAGSMKNARDCFCIAGSAKPPASGHQHAKDPSFLFGGGRLLQIQAYGDRQARQWTRD